MPKEPDFDNPDSPADQEDARTLKAIDEGVRDAQAGRTVSLAEIRKLLPQWITGSSSRKER